MADESDRFSLPFINSGQSQKEAFHNEALALVDMLLHGSVVASGIDTPPASPGTGQCWVVGSSPTGAWAGQAGQVAGWTSGGWRFVAPRAGLALWDEMAGVTITHDGAGWRSGIVAASAVEVGGVQVVGAQGAAIADPAGGATVDTEARAAVSALLGSLRAHGLIAP